MRRQILVAALTLVLPWVAISATALRAQQFTGVWQPTDPGDWNVADNWLLFDPSITNDPGAPGVPSASPFGDHAEVSNGGTAIVGGAVPDVANINLSNGVIQIDDGGSLGAIAPGDPDVGGNLTIGGAGTLSVADGGSFSAELDGSNGGVIAWPSAGASIAFGGNLDSTGVLAPTIVAGSDAPIQVDGAASLSGSVRPSFDGVDPAYGDAWELVAAGSASGSLALDASDAPSLPLGLRYYTQVSDTGALLGVGNQLVATIDRGTGQVDVSNPQGGPVAMKGYTLSSANGLLDADGWGSLSDGGDAAWREANPSANFLNELNLTASNEIALDGSMSLGSAYAPGPQSPSEEDVAFEYITAAGEVVSGVVMYEGPVNDIVLRVDPETGQGALLHESAFFGDQEVKGYSVLSPSGALDPDAWESFAESGAAGEGWRDANSTASALNDLNLDGAVVISQGDDLGLGALFNVGADQDLILEYILADGTVRMGTVTYGPLDAGCSIDWPGDANCDGTTDLADFNILKGNFNTMGGREEGDFNDDGQVDLADFNILKANFNTSAPVPEPSTWVLAAAAGALGLGLRRRRASAC